MLIIEGLFSVHQTAVAGRSARYFLEIFYLHLRLELGQVSVQLSDVLVNQLVGVDGDVDLVV